MDGGVSAMVVAIGIIKLGAALASITGIITGVRYFHTFEYKPKKKGGRQYDNDKTEYYNEKFGIKH
ncbi:hypothetical protein AAXE64_27755 [Priestia megaterium]|uniref:hypothetical protein n=1 Tax=Priestia megaterium TaxID=1404 RepID=UPI003CFDB41D